MHDPGRVLHSLVLLPVSAFVLLVNFPVSAIKNTFSRHRIFALSFFIILECLAICQAYNDAKDGYCNRIPMPYEVAAGRDVLVKLHHSIMAEVKKYEENVFSKKEDNRNIKNLKRPYVEYANTVKGPATLFWSSSTFYTKYSIFLTFTGLSYVIFLFTIIALFAIGRKRIDDSFLKAIVINVAVLSSWFIFRAYSEWYLNLGDFDVQKDGGKFIVLPFDTMVLLLVVYFLYQKKKILSYAASIAAILISLTILIVRLNPDLLFFSLNFPADLSMVNIASMLFTGCFGIGAVLWNFKNVPDLSELHPVLVQPESSVEKIVSVPLKTEEQVIASKFSLPDGLAERYTSEITKRLVEEKLYLDPELTLNKFSKELNIPVHHLSYVLNDKMGQSFSDFVNQHRVEEAKQKLKNPALKNIKIETIGYDCGFNSKATFYRVFKKLCNQSPSEFQKLFIEGNNLAFKA